MVHTPQVIVLQPVLEIQARDGFSFWPVAESEPYSFLPLSGALTPTEIGTAVMSIAACNEIGPDGDDRPPRPADPLGAFLRGLLTAGCLFVSGGLRMTDTATGIVLLPGCCNGLEEWRDWFDVVNGGWTSFGHDPSPLAECRGGAVRLTVDTEQDNSPVIEISVAELRRLLAGAERDLTDFLETAAAWAARHLPDHAVPVTAALARALAVPPSATGRRWQEPPAVDAAAEGRVVTVRCDTDVVAVVDAERRRQHLTLGFPPKAQALAEAGGWSVSIPGLPLAADGASFDDAVANMVDALREYAEDWQERLRTAPNHQDSWGLVQLIALSDDEQLTAWSKGMSR